MFQLENIIYFALQKYNITIIWYIIFSNEVLNILDVMRLSRNPLDIKILGITKSRVFILRPCVPQVQYFRRLLIITFYYYYLLGTIIFYILRFKYWILNYFLSKKELYIMEINFYFINHTLQQTLIKLIM